MKRRKKKRRKERKETRKKGKKKGQRRRKRTHAFRRRKSWGSVGVVGGEDGRLVDLLYTCMKFKK